MDDEKAGLEKLITTAETWADQTGARLWPKPMPKGFETTFVVQAIRGSVDAAMSIKHSVLGDDYSWDVTDYEGEGPAAHVAHNLQVKSHDVIADNCGKALLIATAKARIDQLEIQPAEMTLAPDGDPKYQPPLPLMAKGKFERLSGNLFMSAAAHAERNEVEFVGGDPDQWFQIHGQYAAFEAAVEYFDNCDFKYSD